MGQVQFWEGAILFVGGQVAMDPACCCSVVPGEPCTDCQILQPDAIVSIDGECPDDELCHAAARTYENTGLDADVAFCYWDWWWTQPVALAFRMEFYYCIVSGRWYARLRGGHYYGEWNVLFGGSAKPDCIEDAESDWEEITGLISCSAETGRLAGAFSLDGQLYDGQDCQGCAANVTLGG